MPLVEVRRAIYSYTPAATDELTLTDGDVLYILDNDDPDWLQAKKKQFNIDDPIEQGLVPTNHTELVESIARAKALYDYDPVESEETSLTEGEDVLIIEEDDPDWFMTKSKGGYGFVPKAYVEVVSADTSGPHDNDSTVVEESRPLPPQPAAGAPASPVALPQPPMPPPLPPVGMPSDQPRSSEANSVVARATPATSISAPQISSVPTPPVLPPIPPPVPPQLPSTQPETLPQPPQPPSTIQTAPPPAQTTAQPVDTISHFNVVEGKKKKKGNMVTLGISNSMFMVDSRNDAIPPKKFSMHDVTKCTARKGVLGVEIGGYAPAAFDFACSSNAEAETILDAINSARRGMFVGKKSMDASETQMMSPRSPGIVGTAEQQGRGRTFSSASGASGLSSIPPPLPPKTAVPVSGEFANVLYDFSSEDPEELTVSEGDRVLVIEKPDEEWWKVQLHPPHGSIGLVPAAYVEIKTSLAQRSPTISAVIPVSVPATAHVTPAAVAAPLPPPIPPVPPLDTRNLEDAPPLPERTDAVLKAAFEIHSAEQAKSASPISQMPETGPIHSIANGILSPVSRHRTIDSDNVPLHVLQKRQSETNTATVSNPTPAPSVANSLPGPDMSKVRTWTDGSGAYTVEAQFLSLDAQNNVQLHKTNGKKITVPLSKFAQADMDYVYAITGNFSSSEQATPKQSQTARQRQLESARKTPGKRIINYDWDWFDFFTLKAGVSADNALKYATSFVAERLDDQSIPEITTALMQQLGVRPTDIPNIERAFRVHRGLPTEDATASQLDNLFSLPTPASQNMQDPQNALRSLVANQAAANVSAANPADVSLVPPQLPPRLPTTTSAPTAAVATTAKQTTKSDSNPWGMESELDRRVGRLKQIKDDEELARKLQQEEKDHRKRDKKQSFWHRHQNDPKNAKPDPFTSLDGTPNGGGGSSSGGHHQRTGSSAANGHKQPLNLASGSSRKKANKSQISVVDPSQLRTAQQKLS
ncbi:cytoskeletal protein binding protein, partial [Coemansia sp. Benny D160-2]